MNVNRLKLAALFFISTIWMQPFGLSQTHRLVAQEKTVTPTKVAGSIRVATFNVALNRQQKGDLLKELESGASESASKVAAIIQKVRPDILLINEIDFDGGKTVAAFSKLYLEKSQHGQKAISYDHRFVAPVNTGVKTGLDLNGDGDSDDPDDAFGFGRFAGQYGMAVLSRHPVDSDNVRTFQKFLWKDMPGALLPIDPETGKPWYSKEAIARFRLSSKSHWDVPIKVDDKVIHFLVSHPTPPVFDNEEDRNGRRNHDEIRLWAEYISGGCEWLYDDKGVTGPISKGASFIIAGDLNADPNDGDSTDDAIDQLLGNSNILSSPIPSSTGGKHFAELEGKANLKHTGDPSHDTGNFNDETAGNVRVDYVLPSKDLVVVGAGVFWPKPGEDGAALAEASDHRLVWIDVKLP